MSRSDEANPGKPTRVLESYNGKPVRAGLAESFQGWAGKGYQGQPTPGGGDPPTTNLPGGSAVAPPGKPSPSASIAPLDKPQK